jgi:hypothetical protein
MALRSTQHLTEMSTRIFPGDKKRQELRANNIAAVYVPNVWKCGSLNLCNPKGLHGLYKGKLYLLLGLYVTKCSMGPGAE